MRKIVILLCILIAGYSAPLNAAEPSVNSRSAILMDAETGQILFDKKMHLRSAPASTTKIMTAIIAVESGRLNEIVKVSPRAAATPGSTMNLYPGQKITLRELVTGLLLRSGNDAAIAIAEHLAGSEAAFVELMNRKALILGAADTKFANPHGLSSAGHYSSAYDLALLARYALTNPLFAEIVNTKETNIEWLDRKGHGRNVNLRNTNKLLWMLAEADGVKTGTTSEAGPCLVSSATRDNQRLIAVVLHDHHRWYDSMQLLKYGFDNYELYDYAEQGEIVAEIPVEKGFAEFMQAVAGENAALVVKSDEYPKISTEVDLPEKIKAPVCQGQKIGEIVFFIGDKAVKTVDIVANKTVEEKTVGRVLLGELLKSFRLMSSWGIL